MACRALLGGQARLIWHSACSRTGRNAGLILSGTFTSALLRFAAGVLLARELPVEMWGQLALFIAVMDFVSIVSDCGSGPVQVRFASAHPGTNPLPVLRHIVRIKAVLVLSVVVGAAVVYWPYMQIQRLPFSLGGVYIWAVAAGLFLSASTVPTGLMQSQQFFGRCAALTASANVFRLAFVALALQQGYTSYSIVAPAFFAAPILAFVVGLALMPSALRGLGERPPSPVTQREVVRFLIPVGIMQVIIIAAMRADVLMLGAMAGATAAAEYNTAYQFAYCVPLVTSALFNALLPTVSAMRTAAELAAFRHRVLRLYPAALVLTVLGVLVMPWVLELLLGGKYAASARTLQLLVLAFGIPIIYNPLSLVFYALDKPQVNTAIHLGQLLLLIPLNFVLIPRLGILGPAVSLLIVYILSVIAVIFLTGAAILAKQKAELAFPSSIDK